MIDGRTAAGANAIAGKWGHNPLPGRDAGEHPGPRCYCGRHGCSAVTTRSGGAPPSFAWPG